MVTQQDLLSIAAADDWHLCTFSRDRYGFFTWNWGERRSRFLLSTAEWGLLHINFRRETTGFVTEYSWTGAASHEVQERETGFVTEYSWMGTASHEVQERHNWFCCWVELNRDCFTWRSEERHGCYESGQINWADCSEVFKNTVLFGYSVATARMLRFLKWGRGTRITEGGRMDQTHRTGGLFLLSMHTT